MCSFYAILVENVTKIRNKKKKQSRLLIDSSSHCGPTTRTAYLLHELKKYTNVTVKAACLCSLGTIFLVSLTVFIAPNKTSSSECCSDRGDFDVLERALRASSTFVRVLKYISMSIVCFFILKASHSRLKSSIANVDDLIDKLFATHTSSAKINSGLKDLC